MASRGRPALVLTAGMGAGHNGVAHELASRLEAAGTPAVVIDVLEVMPLSTGRLMRGFYHLMIRFAPWLYDVVYAGWFRPRGERRAGPVSPVTMPIERFVTRFVGEHDPMVAVSTFHLCSQVLGHMRKAGTLRVPAVTVIVDPAVSRLWVHPNVDRHLCYHPGAADSARAQGARGVSAPGPVVRQSFTRAAASRDATRASLGVGHSDRAALVSGGSWGVGAVEETVLGLTAARSWVPVVVCGHNSRLRRRLARLQGVIALGLVEDMASLVGASDVFVDNAGGLSAMEALGAGVPLICHRPLAGHGKANVAAMVEAGVALDAKSDLPGALETVADPSRRRGLLDAAARLFAGDPAREILDAAELAVGRTVPGGEQIA